MCCCDIKKDLGCFGSCGCVGTGIILTDAGTYKIVYWFPASNNKFSLEYESIGGTELVLPAVFNPGNYVYFTIQHPNGSQLIEDVAVCNPITGKDELIQTSCFSFFVYQGIYRDVASCNPDVPEPCLDCESEHSFSVTSPLIVNYNIPAAAPITQNGMIKFQREACCQSIVIKKIVSDYNAVAIENPLTYVNTGSYNDGFVFSFGGVAGRILQAGDVVQVTVSFVCLSKSGVNQVECESPIQSVLIVFTYV